MDLHPAIQQLITRYPSLRSCTQSMEDCCKILWQSVSDEKTILLCGNGGSYADCEHISGELLKSSPWRADR